MAKKIIKNNKKYQGFSLLEVLIAMFIFTLMFTASISVFSEVFSARQKAREIERNIEDARTAIDLMAKNMRMSTSLKKVIGEETVYMYNTSQEQCISYKFEGKELKISQANPAGADDKNCDPSHVAYGSFNPITSDNVSGKFVITETKTSSPKIIGKATVNMEINESINVQTTVSFRDYDDIIQ